MRDLDVVEGNVLISKSDKNIVLELEFITTRLGNPVFEFHLNEIQVDKLQALLHYYYNVRAVTKVEEQEGM